MLFLDFNLNPSIIKAIEDQKYEKPTPIQEKAIPSILSGKDLLGCAQTGTGKTAAFAMPILHMLSKDSINQRECNQIRALVLAPTRELAIQIGESFETYGQHLNIQIGVIYGGVTPKRHIKVLKREPNILVATPGRLLDLSEQVYVDLSSIEIFVLDEADRMLDLGMIKDVKTIISKLPKVRQNMLFSATMPKEISKLIHSILRNPVKIEVKSNLTDERDIKQQVYFIDEPDKTSLLLHLLKDKSFESVLVFVRTKIKADKVSKAINIANIRTKAIHGDKNQSERLKALELFKNKEIRVLVATDVAARGIDIEKLSHVVNMDIPNIPETYIHRIGRTGRAGMGGTAVSFCSSQETAFLKDIEELQGGSIEVMEI
ncbi:DEAD/DEAH box helicase [Cellulosilyticum sp. I15G10I2]|uniref:DEAD/DEAH box helicase n=1 Tax=Cellulosilyticum sp. I15G10I2 TaxID=1892843 RepID=UPI00085C8BFF|nr:DEAD/DEAH box helicase [Cellulosilyticum sp. I15G10I2]